MSIHYVHIAADSMGSFLCYFKCLFFYLDIARVGQIDAREDEARIREVRRCIFTYIYVYIYICYFI